MRQQLKRNRWIVLGALFALTSNTLSVAGLKAPQQSKPVRLAIIGLNHDHVWGLLQDISQEPSAELVAIAETDPALVQQAKGKAGASVRFFADYVKMLDETKPEAVIVTTSNDRHLEILRECAKRRIHFSTEKPMATSAEEAREMEQLASAAGIKVMVNYWNVWVAPSHALVEKVHAQEVGPIRRMVVQYGHEGPKEIGVSPQFASWLYDPKKNGGGAVMDFGCYGAEFSVWLKGRPARVFATTRRLKTDQHNAVDDDATIVLEYPDATTVIEASWDWPYSKQEIEVFGPKGSLVAGNRNLLFRSANAKAPFGSR